MRQLREAKSQLDTVIKKGRVHLYKPIQIAEILWHHREDSDFDLDDLESYRNPSKKWRNTVSLRLVGRKCTSSARFQDNLFDPNAMPPRLIAVLGEENELWDREGIVEAYIYRAMVDRLDVLKGLADYVANATPESFDLLEFLDGFRKDAGLRRSIDKAYEITVYALFDTLVRHLEATVTLRIPAEKLSLLEDFEDFTEMVLNVNAERSEITVPAKLYRVGVANAADRGIDMWANFGPAVQVKHLSLTEDMAEEIVAQVEADKIVIVCQTAEKDMIQRVLTQLGFSDRIQGIATESDLIKWYSRCFSPKYRNTLGISILDDFHREFMAEFPATDGVLSEFFEERGYNDVEMEGVFATDE